MLSRAPAEIANISDATRAEIAAINKRLAELGYNGHGQVYVGKQSRMHPQHFCATMRELCERTKLAEIALKGSRAVQSLVVEQSQGLAAAGADNNTKDAKRTRTKKALDTDIARLNAEIVRNFADKERERAALVELLERCTPAHLEAEEQEADALIQRKVKILMQERMMQAAGVLQKASAGKAAPGAQPEAQPEAAPGAQPGAAPEPSRGGEPPAVEEEEAMRRLAAYLPAATDEL